MPRKEFLLARLHVVLLYVGKRLLEEGLSSVRVVRLIVRNVGKDFGLQLAVAKVAALDELKLRLAVPIEPMATDTILQLLRIGRSSNVPTSAAEGSKMTCAQYDPFAGSVAPGTDALAGSTVTAA